MPRQPQQILKILDACCEAFTFPMLDNGYVYLGASRLTLYASEMDWAMVIEIFGYSPRSGAPDVATHTYASRLHNRNPIENYVSEDAYQAYLKNNPHNDTRFFYPIDGDSWLDPENEEMVAADAHDLTLRDHPVGIPSADRFREFGIALEKPPRVHVFELCQALAATHRDQVLATSGERTTNVVPNLPQIMQLNEWHHPNLVDGERCSDSETFQQLSKVLASADPAHYRPSQSANTHWRNWPAGGRL